MSLSAFGCGGVVGGGAPVALVSGVVGATAAPGNRGLIPRYEAVPQLFVARKHCRRAVERAVGTVPHLKGCSGVVLCAKREREARRSGSVLCRLSDTCRTGSHLIRIQQAIGCVALFLFI